MSLAETKTLNGGPDFEVVLVADFGALAPIRQEVARRLDVQAVDSEKVDDVLLVVCELCTNAIQATESRAPILIRVRIGDGAVVVEVENVGPSFDAANEMARRGGRSDAERGRGLAIVRALSDDHSVHFQHGRCTMRAVIARSSH